LRKKMAQTLKTFFSVVPAPHTAASTSQAPPPVSTSKKRKRDRQPKDELHCDFPEWMTSEERAGHQTLWRVFHGDEQEATYFKGRLGRKPVLSGICCTTFRLYGGCHNCVTNCSIDMKFFAPNADSIKTAGKRQRFDVARKAFVFAVRAGDRDTALRQRRIVEQLRSRTCKPCRRIVKLSPAVQSCKDEWDRMKQEACRRQGGCSNPDCSERGMASWIALQADHGTNPKRYNLSDYSWWAYHGGVAAMRKEAKQIFQWCCGHCHSLEATSASGRRYGDPDLMPNGRQYGTKEETAQYKAKYHAKIKFPKQQYVDRIKREIGICQYSGCGRRVVIGNEQGFQWDHQHENSKRKCRCLNANGEPKGPCHGCEDKLFRRNGGVGGLVANCSKAASLRNAKHLLDAEMKKCLLYCTPCHLSRKPRNRDRWDESLE
jgi:hypothetical protein